MATGDEILSWIKAAQEQKPVELTLCPRCDWTIEKNKEGILHCKFCGWIQGDEI